MTDALARALEPDQPPLGFMLRNGILLLDAPDAAAERLFAESGVQGLTVTGQPPVAAARDNCQAAPIADHLACGLRAAGTVVASLFFTSRALPLP